jgi:pSer/pThr/pTyr-binding forkhead associated (FHA) protein
VTPDAPRESGGSTRLLAGALVRCALRGEVARAGPHLLVRPPGAAERAVALPAELTVGRGQEAGLVIEDPGASRVHARIQLSADGAAQVLDLGSKNGLRLNGQRLAAGPAPLRPGDELTVGATRVRFVDPLSQPPGEEAGAGGSLAQPAGSAGTGGHDGGSAWRLLAASAGLLAFAALLLGLG